MTIINFCSECGHVLVWKQVSWIHEFDDTLMCNYATVDQLVTNDGLDEDHIIRGYN